MFTRIRFRIFGIVLLAVIPAIVLIFYSAAERKRQDAEEIENNALRLSRFLASNMERDVSEGEEFLDACAMVLESKNLSPSNASGVLAKFLSDSSVYSNVGLAKSDGSVEYSAFPIKGKADVYNLNWFRNAKASGDFTVGFDLGGVLGNQASINLALPLKDKKGTLERILFAVMDLDWINELAEKSQLSPGSIISVTNKAGEAVARFPDPEKWVGKVYPKSHVLTDEEAGKAGIKLALGVDAIKRVYAYAPVHGKGGLVVHLGIKPEVMYAHANHALLQQLLALSLVSILALLVAWFGSDVFLLKQVRALIAATKGLAQGNLGARSSLSYDQGELGELARAFDEMAETLEWRDAQLKESETERANPMGQIFELVEVSPEAAVILDGSFQVIAANRVAQEVFGYPPDEFLGRPFSSLCPEISEESVARRLQPGGKGPLSLANLRTRATGRHWNGSSIPLEISLSRSVLGKQAIVMVIIRLMEERVPT